MKLRPEEVHAFVGKRGSGKSTRAKELCAEVMRAGQRIVVFDYHDEYSQLGNASKQVRLGPLRHRVQVDEFLAAAADDSGLLESPELALAVVPSGDPKECAEDFEEVAAVISSTGRLVFLVEEVGVVSERAEQRLNYLACQSRHDEVPLVLVAQRMVQVPKTARTQISHLNSGRQDDPADLDALAKIAGQDFADQVSRLGRGECADWRDDTWAQAPKKEKRAS